MTDKTTTTAAQPQPRDTFDTVMNAARLTDPVRDGFRGSKVFLVPERTKLEQLTDPDALPPVIAQAVTLDTADSAAAYINRFSDPSSVLVADYEKGEVTAHLDWHHHNDAERPLAPRHNRHRAVFRLLPSEEWTRWDTIEGTMLEQAEFGRFLEENAVDISAPDPATMIEIARDLEATQGVKFSAKTRLENGDRGFTYETETHTRGEMAIPTRFTLTIPLYHGEEPVEIECLFRYRITPAGLLLGFNWRRAEYMRRAHFEQIATRLSEETGLPMFAGRLGG